MFPASRAGSASFFAMRRENRKMQNELAKMKAELAKERFSRDLDGMVSEGYAIPDSHRPRLIAELTAAKNPEVLLDAWRDLFARDPMGVRIDMSRASLPAGDIDTKQVSDLVREFAGKPEEFKKAINSRLKGR
jgi:hypothetical protein